MYTTQFRKPYSLNEIERACESKEQELLYTTNGKYQRYGKAVKGIVKARYISKDDYPAYRKKMKVRRESRVPKFVKVERTENGLKFYLNKQLHSIRVLVHDKYDNLIHSEILYSPHWYYNYGESDKKTSSFLSKRFEVKDYLEMKISLEYDAETYALDKEVAKRIVAYREKKREKKAEEEAYWAGIRKALDGTLAGTLWDAKDIGEIALEKWHQAYYGRPSSMDKKNIVTEKLTGLGLDEVIDKGCDKIKELVKKGVNIDIGNRPCEILGSSTAAFYLTLNEDIDSDAIQYLNQGHIMMKDKNFRENHTLNIDDLIFITEHPSEL